MVRHETTNDIERLRLYFAAPLFSLAELSFNEMLVNKLEMDFAVFLPQRDGQLFTELVATGIPSEEAAKRVFDKDTTAIRNCDILLAVLDGRTVDEGAAFELGMAYSLNKICIGLQTDSRRLLPSGNNPMVSCALHAKFENMDQMFGWLSAFAARSGRLIKSECGPLAATCHISP